MRNIANKTDGVGDTLTAGDFNSFNEELENAVLSTDQSLDVAGGPDTNLNMLGNAIAAYANAGSTYQDSGSTNSYILAISSNLKSVTKYYDRMSVRFKPGSSNTGPSTVNVNNLGVKNIVDEIGVALVANTIIINRYITLTYILSSDIFELLSGDVTQTGSETLTNKTFESPVINIGVSGSAISDSTPEKSSESGSSGSDSTISRGDHEHPVFQMIIWRMTTNESVGTQEPVGGGGSDWEVADTDLQSTPLGNQLVTESSGTFSFTETGWWSIRAYGHGSGTAASNTQASVNMSSNTGVLVDAVSNISDAGRRCHISLEALVKITDISTQKIHLAQSDNATNTFSLLGSTSANKTYIVFEKKSDL